MNTLVQANFAHRISLVLMIALMLTKCFFCDDENSDQVSHSHYLKNAFGFGPPQQEQLDFSVCQSLEEAVNCWSCLKFKQVLEISLKKKLKQNCLGRYIDT